MASRNAINDDPETGGYNVPIKLNFKICEIENFLNYQISESALLSIFTQILWPVTLNQTICCAKLSIAMSN